MPLPLPDLDDRRWDDLVDEARALIPRLAPAWTDYNASDPGISLLELLAYVTEADTFRIDRIPRRHRAAFLALAGIRARPVVPAVTPVAFRPTGAGAVSVPAGVVLSAADGTGSTAHQLRVEGGITVLGCALVAVQVWTGSDFVDRTQDRRHRAAFDAFGPDPAGTADEATAPALLLGFDPSPALAADARMSLWLTCDDAASIPAAGSGAGGDAGRHHAVTVSWEFHDGTAWQPLDDGSLVDDTRALTRSGRVTLPFGELAAVGSVLGAVTARLRWVRVRLAHGRHDVAPRVSEVLSDTVPVVQAVPASASWRLARTHDPLGALPIGVAQRLALRTDAAGDVLAAQPAGASDPDAVEALVLHVGPDSLGLALLPGGVADGAPSFAAQLVGAPFVGDTAAVWTLDEQGPRRWDVVDTLRRSGPADRHVEFEPRTGMLLFGDGVHGRVPPAGAGVAVRVDRSDGVTGTPTQRALWRLDTDDPITAAVTATAPIAAAGLELHGASGSPARAAEDLETAEGRAADGVWTHERLVEYAPRVTDPTLDQLGRAVVLSRSCPQRATTTLDHERLALDVPGTAVLRARAWAGVDPAFPGFAAPGTVAVVVVPGLPAGRPVPTPELLARVRSHLCPRRTLGTRLVVSGPDYVTVTVTATVRALPRADPERVRADALVRLRAYLDPLTGGPAALGWPFGRDVAQADVLRQLDLVEGLDHVVTMAILADGVDVDCGSVCVGPLSLVVSGPHEVSVL